MQAIILAAGMGKRLGSLTQQQTKCMVEVADRRLIDRTLDLLEHQGIHRTILVTGYCSDGLQQYVGSHHGTMDIVYVNNPIYETTNNIYSLFLARDFLVQEETLLLESDIIFEEAVLKKAIESPHPTLAVVDRYENWMDGTVVTINEQNDIIQFISKSQFNFSETDHYFKTVNIYKFDPIFSSEKFIPFLEVYCKTQGHNAYYEQVLQVMTQVGGSPLKALPLEGECWYEIDDLQDLDIAESLFAQNDEACFNAINSRYGGFWRYPKMLDFCYLVNPYFPPQRMVDEMQSSFSTLLREYPSGMRVNSQLAAKIFNLKPDQIAIGNGAAELIKSLMEQECRQTFVSFPTFEEYPNRKAGEQVTTFVPQNSDFHYTADDLILHLQSLDSTTLPSSLLLINPDNPSGNYIGYTDLLRLIEYCQQHNIQLVVDESFVDFAEVEGPTSLLNSQLLENNPHLLVVKSISKSYGVPGLRLGVIASGNHALIDRIKKEVAIWNINSFAEFYLQIFDKYAADYKKACQLFRAERTRFQAELSKVPYLRIIDSQANYFLCEVTGRFSSRQLAIQLLKTANILIKDCSSKRGFDGKNYIRVAVRNTEDNDRLVASMLKLIQK